MHSVKDYRLQTQKLSTERDEAIVRATRGLESVKGARERRANVSTMQVRVDELKAGLAKLRKDNDKKRARLQSLRETLATRRQALSAAKIQSSSNFAPPSTSITMPGSLPGLSSSIHALPPSPSSNTSSSLTPLINQYNTSLAQLHNALHLARTALIAELVEVFNIVQLGGRPSMNGRPGVSGEWSIANLVLPVPGDVKRYPTEHINAVLTNTIRFVELVGFYLGVKMPFQVTWSGRKLGVGVPWIGSIRGYGGSSGEWARWHSKYPLHLTNSSSPLLPPQASESEGDADADSSESTEYEYLTISPERKSKSKRATDAVDVDRTPTQSTIISSSPAAPTSTSTFTQKEDLADSVLHTTAKDRDITVPSFTTALAMLIYNVSYLAYTQNVDIPLAQAGDVLGNLWAVCCSPELGRRSHETRLFLPPPTPPQFQLDFGQLLQATARGPKRREAVMRRFSTSTASSNSSAPTSPPATSLTGTRSSSSSISASTTVAPFPADSPTSTPGSSGRPRPALVSMPGSPSSNSSRRRSSVSLAKDVIRSGRWGRDRDRDKPPTEEEEWDLVEEEDEVDF
ncbi:hypothetical protein D9758_011903 [Tetrapyrgos nigripes]|uniref:Autophagy-related protein 14 n=1 Tax=Tetrapyrgos nigripes TaxID=182062 RepID=A0A8H5CSE1_9AGAR|nr:hypothetical protein D9758_011903 [Tetrapyrgos nigripes]